MTRTSTPRRTQVPAIPEIDRSAEGIDRSLRAIKENLEVGYGRRGDPLDRFATLRDLRDGGIAGVAVDGRGGAIVTGPSGPGTGAPLPDGPTRPDYGDNDYTAPPKPQNVRARGMPPDTNPAMPPGQSSMGVVMVTWDSPGYGNHYYAEVYRMKRGDFPQDGQGNPLFAFANHGMNGNYAHGVDRGDGQINQIVTGFGVFAGIATGTIFVDTGLPELPTGGNELDQALNPGQYFYWVRFVSRAMVPGPLSDRSGAVLSINPARVLDAMTRNVTNTEIFRNLRGWLALGSPEASSGASILEYVEQEISDNLISNVWSVRMANRVDGMVWAAGFGLSLDTRRNDDGDWESLSTFLVNANQFAIMGPNTLGAGSIITHWQTLDSQRIRLTLSTSAHGFVAPFPGDPSPRQRAILMIPSGDIRTENPSDPDNPFITSIPYSPWAGAELEVVEVQGTIVTLTSDIDDRQPQNTNLPSFVGAPFGALQPQWQCALMPGSNIPFIVDTVRNVVGIRGRLIVDGLVRATEGEFNTLTANTAFIRTVQAEVVNANVVIGQRIIAGTPGQGPITPAQYNGISNYVIEMNNPAVSPFPLRFWKPSTGHTVFSVNQNADLFVGGHLTVGGNAVIANEAPLNTLNTLFSTGGPDGQGSSWAMWIGSKLAYGSAGQGRREDNGIMWVKSNGRAGMNADFFLGNNAMSLPALAAGNQSGSGFTETNNGPRATSMVLSAVTSNALRVRPLRNGQAALTMVQVSGICMRFRDGPGGSADGRSKRFRFKVQLVGSPGASFGTVVQDIEMDDYSPETWDYNLMGVVQVPAGDYYVRLDLVNVEPSKGEVSILQGWNAVAMQLTAGGGLSGDGVNSQYAAPAALPPLEIRGPDAEPNMILATEAIPAGRFVHVYIDKGAPGVRLADAVVGYAATGYVLEPAELGQFVEVHTDGQNTRLSGLTAGEVYALGTSGQVVTLASAPTAGSGHLLQRLGTAIGGTAMDVEIQPATERSA